MHVVNYELPTTSQGGIDEYVHRIGRTARIGHRGLATSFYTDRNADLAPELAKLLHENEQEIPDFLFEYNPENAANTEPNGETEGAGWGAEPQTNGNADGDAFGAGQQSNDGFQADAGGSGSGWN